jgi:cell division septation protein DedD
VAKAAPPAESPVAEKPSANLIHYQIAAVKRRSDAEKLFSGLKKKGFRALILPPAPNDSKPFFRVQVGPFSDPVEAAEAKKKLERDGYQAILKK